MISVAEIVEEQIKTTPFLEEGLNLGILNYTSLARQLQPVIQRELVKDVKLGSIVMALKRLSQKIKSKHNYQDWSIKDITIRSNLVELTYVNSPTLFTSYISLLQESGNNSICSLTNGIRETTIIISENLLQIAQRTLHHEILLFEQKNLDAITVSLPTNNVRISGIYYTILKLFAWVEISVQEVISTYTELTIVVKNQDIEKAFSILKSRRNQTANSQT